MAYITEAQLKEELAAYLHLTDSADLPAWWSPIIATANDSAYQTIVEKLLGRGYTMANIDAWSRRVEFSKYIGVYRALVAGVGVQAESDIWAEKLVRWEDELNEVALPDVAVGSVSFGKFDFPSRRTCR